MSKTDFKYKSIMLELKLYKKVKEPMETFWGVSRYGEFVRYLNRRCISPTSLLFLVLLVNRFGDWSLFSFTRSISIYWTESTILNYNFKLVVNLCEFYELC